MNSHLQAFSTYQLPSLVEYDGNTARQFLEFFAANIRNPNTRKTYARATMDFMN